MQAPLKYKYQVGRTYKGQKCSRAGNSRPSRSKNSSHKRPYVPKRALTYRDGRWRMEPID